MLQSSSNATNNRYDMIKHDTDKDETENENENESEIENRSSNKNYNTTMQAHFNEAVIIMDLD